MQIYTEPQIRAVINEAAALQAVRRAFLAMSTRAITMPAPLALNVDAFDGELHVKAAYLHDSQYFTVKAATGYSRNAERGLPAGSGLMIVFDATNGMPVALLQDNAYLTEMRTAAAGALAIQTLAVRPINAVAVIGAGAQADYQLRALNACMQWTNTRIWNRTRSRAEARASALRDVLSASISIADTVDDAVRGADVVITVTSSRDAIVDGDALASHATIIAVGADGPHKRELMASVFERAGLVVVDSLAQCVRLGEVHHAVREGKVREAECVELGDIVAGKAAGRKAHELIICDLTGLGAQDAAIAEAAITSLGHGPGSTSWRK